jgi:hypothetical protein
VRPQYINEEEAVKAFPSKKEEQKRAVGSFLLLRQF